VVHVDHGIHVAINFISPHIKHGTELETKGASRAGGNTTPPPDGPFIFLRRSIMSIFKLKYTLLVGSGKSDSKSKLDILKDEFTGGVLQLRSRTGLPILLDYVSSITKLDVKGLSSEEKKLKGVSPNKCEALLDNYDRCGRKSTSDLRPSLCPGHHLRYLELKNSYHDSVWNTGSCSFPHKLLEVYHASVYDNGLLFAARKMFKLDDSGLSMSESLLNSLVQCIVDRIQAQLLYVNHKLEADKNYEGHILVIVKYIELLACFSNSGDLSENSRRINPRLQGKAMKVSDTSLFRTKREAIKSLLQATQVVVAPPPPVTVAKPAQPVQQRRARRKRGKKVKSSASTDSPEEVGATDPPTVAVTEVGATEVGVTEVGATEVGVTEVGVTEVGVTEVGVTEVGVTEVGATDPDVASVENPPWVRQLYEDELEQPLVKEGLFEAPTFRRDDVTVESHPYPISVTREGDTLLVRTLVDVYVPVDDGVRLVRNEFYATGDLVDGKFVFSRDPQDNDYYYYESGEYDLLLNDFKRAVGENLLSVPLLSALSRYVSKGTYMFTPLRNLCSGVSYLPQVREVFFSYINEKQFRDPKLVGWISYCVDKHSGEQLKFVLRSRVVMDNAVKLFKHVLEGASLVREATSRPTTLDRDLAFFFGDDLAERVASRYVEGGLLWVLDGSEKLYREYLTRETDYPFFFIRQVTRMSRPIAFMMLTMCPTLKVAEQLCYIKCRYCAPLKVLSAIPEDIFQMLRDIQKVPNPKGPLLLTLLEEEKTLVDEETLIEKKKNKLLDEKIKKIQEEKKKLRDDQETFLVDLKELSQDMTNPLAIELLDKNMKLLLEEKKKLLNDLSQDTLSPELPEEKLLKEKKKLLKEKKTLLVDLNELSQDMTNTLNFLLSKFCTVFKDESKEKKWYTNMFNLGTIIQRSFQVAKFVEEVTPAIIEPGEENRLSSYLGGTLPENPVLPETYPNISGVLPVVRLAQSKELKDHKSVTQITIEAVCFFDVKHVTKLLEFDEDFSSKWYGWSLIHVAAATAPWRFIGTPDKLGGRDLNRLQSQVLQMLLDKHTPQTNQPDSFLSVAVLFGVKNAVEFLVRRDPASVNEKESNALMTPLHKSLLVSAEISNFLIQNGADVTAQDFEGDTPLHYALATDDPMKVLGGLGKQEIEKLLTGACNLPNHKGDIPLQFALVKGDKKLEKLILQYTAKDFADQLFEQKKTSV